METFVECLKNLVRAGGQKAFAIAFACSILLWIDRAAIFALSSGIKETVVVLGVTSACVLSPVLVRLSGNGSIL